MSTPRDKNGIPVLAWRNGRRTQGKPTEVTPPTFAIGTTLNTGAVGVCELCGQKRPLTKHHLVPKSMGGMKTVNLCAPCHLAVHETFGLQPFMSVEELSEALKTHVIQVTSAYA